VLKYDDDEVAAETQARILGSPDEHASKALGNVCKDVRTDRTKDVVKALAAAQKKSRRGKRGNKDKEEAPGGGGNYPSRWAPRRWGDLTTAPSPRG